MSLNDVRPALRTFLLEDATVAAAVGGLRIFPTVMPQGVVTASLVYNVISEITDHHTQGASGLVMVRMQLDAYATTPDDADTLARAVKERIDGYAGLMGSVTVQGVFAENARTGYEADADLYRVSRDYLIHFEER